MMKHARSAAKSGMAAKLSRMRGGGDVSRVVKGMPSRDGSKGYANGGGIMDGDDVDGGGARPRMGKPSRTKGDKGKKGGTNVNVIIMPKEAAAGAPPPQGGPMPPPPGPPPGAPPGPPPGMPMRARGGRVEKHPDAKEDKKMIASMIHKHETHEHGGKLTKFKRGGLVKEHAGAGGGLGRLAKIRSYGPKAGKAC